MANAEARATSNLVQRTSANTSDRIVVLSDPAGNAQTVTVSIATIFSNTNGLMINLGAANTPANSTSLTVKAGTILYDANYLYVATANNLVKRVGTLTTF